MALDPSKPYEKELLDRFMQFADTADGPWVFSGLERRDAILARTQDVTVITDDNMASEWLARLKFPLVGDE